MSISSEQLAALDQQNRQLAYFQAEFQKDDTAKTYRLTHIQFLRGWRGMVARLYALLAAFFVFALAYLTWAAWADLSPAAVAARAALGAAVVAFPWCIPGLASLQRTSFDAATAWLRRKNNPYLFAT